MTNSRTLQKSFLESLLGRLLEPHFSSSKSLLTQQSLNAKQYAQHHSRTKRSLNLELLETRKLMTVSGSFVPTTGVVSIEINSSTITTDALGQQETLRLASDSLGNRLRFLNKQNGTLVVFGNDTFPVTSIVVAMTGSNPVNPGLGGLLDLDPAFPGPDAGPGNPFGAVRDPIIVTGGNAADEIRVTPFNSVTINGGGGNDTIQLKSQNASVSVGINGDSGNDMLIVSFGNSVSPVGNINYVGGENAGDNDRLFVTDFPTGSMVGNVPTGAESGIASVDSAMVTYSEVELVEMLPELPPDLINPGNQTTPNGATNVVVNLVATDPNLDLLTYSATIESLETVIDQQYGLEPADLSMYFNWGGLKEKWFKGTVYPWLYMTPDGKLYAWRGGSIIGNDILIEQFSVEVYKNPQLLFNPSNIIPATVTVAGNVLTINPDDNFVGKFRVKAKADDGLLSDTESFFVSVTGPSPDTTVPTITNRSPVPSSTITQSILNLDVAFSEFVTGVDSTDMVLSGPGSASASVGPPVHVGANVWRFPISGLVNGTLNVQLAPDANDIEDVAGNDLASASWSYTVALAGAPLPPILNPIANQTLSSGQVNAVVNLVAIDPNNDPLTFSATAESIERYLDQSLDLKFSGQDFLNWGGRNEKWLLGNAGWYYLLPTGEFYRWLGGSLDNAILIERVNPAAYLNLALLYDAPANNSNAVLTIVGNVLTVNPLDTFVGKIFVTAKVTDTSGGSDTKSFLVTVGL